ncbi:MAG TPA: twin-arginine translocation signal domain-containing protein [Nitriliruptorales bacterium]|nr:twin-arginine translocation signal domain-containing protein [Nitriliruptorales bacterium]
MTDEINEAPHPLATDQSRRDFLKRSAATGALMWSAPAILSLPGGGAWANQYPCPCPGCDAQATAASIGQLALVRSDSGCQCLANATLGSGTPSLSAQVACAEANDAACTARAFLAGVRIQIGLNTFITATTLSSCVDCGTGNSFVADLALLVGSQSTPLQLSANCNGTVLGLGNLATAVFNEQTCANGVLTVNALRVTVLGIDVIVGQSKAGAAGCPCQACAQARCTPPRERLC